MIVVVLRIIILFQNEKEKVKKKFQGSPERVKYTLKLLLGLATTNNNNNNSYIH